MKKNHLDKQELGWMEWDSAMAMFPLAKSRVYSSKGDLNFEIPPKWEVFIFGDK